MNISGSMWDLLGDLYTKFIHSNDYEQALTADLLTFHCWSSLSIKRRQRLGLLPDVLLMFCSIYFNNLQKKIGFASKTVVSVNSSSFFDQRSTRIRCSFWLVNFNIRNVSVKSMLSARWVAMTAYVLRRQFLAVVCKHSHPVTPLQDRCPVSRLLHIFLSSSCDFPNIFLS